MVFVVKLWLKKQSESKVLRTSAHIQSARYYLDKISLCLTGITFFTRLRRLWRSAEGFWWESGCCFRPHLTQTDTQDSLNPLWMGSCPPEGSVYKTFTTTSSLWGCPYSQINLINHTWDTHTHTFLVDYSYVFISYLDSHSGLSFILYIYIYIYIYTQEVWWPNLLLAITEVGLHTSQQGFCPTPFSTSSTNHLVFEADVWQLEPSAPSTYFLWD